MIPMSTVRKDCPQFFEELRNQHSFNLESAEPRLLMDEYFIISINSATGKEYRLVHYDYLLKKCKFVDASFSDYKDASKVAKKLAKKEWVLPYSESLG